MNKLEIPTNLINSDDSEEDLANDEINNFKGIFYNDEEEKQFYEAGAHFSYNFLFKALEKIYYELSPSRQGDYNGDSQCSNIITKRIAPIRVAMTK